MGSEVSVERQYRFHCSCGTTTISGERKVTCTGCGDLLGLRRVRRRQQLQDSVAYYGSSTPPVRRVVRRRHHPNAKGAALAGSTSKIGLKLRIALTNLGEFLIQVSRVDKGTGPARVASQTASENASGMQRQHLLLPETKASVIPLPVRGVHVKVRATGPSGRPHPHAGKTGRITRFIDTYPEPTVMIKLDSGIEPPGFIWVTVGSLEL
jgi:hypothetical protein